VSGNHFHKTAKPAGSVGLQKGKVIPSLSNVGYHDSPKTLLIALNTKCQYCQENVPFYKKLVELRKANVNYSHLVAVFPNDESEIRQFLKQNHLNLDAAALVNLDSLGITATPALVLVDNNSKISDFWIGSLSVEQEEQVIQALRVPAS